MRPILLKPALLLLLFFCARPAVSQPDTSPLVVMNLAAHPDDEDGSTLAYYRHARNAVAYSVIFTRGEGGQNEIGPELYEELGAVRTRETERAARHLGTQVFFLNFKDFGFSKSAEETYERWGGKEDVMARLVYLIRKLKPDVLFTNHDTVTVGPNRQHGHHQVVGLSADEAFELASDPNFRADQLDEPGVDLWQPKRLFRRLWSSDGSHDVAVPVGRTDPALGISYAELAARGLDEHVSQGMDRFARMVAGWDSTYFKLYRSATEAPLSATDLAANLPPNDRAEPDITYWIASNRVAPLPGGAIAVSDSVVVPGARVQVRWRPEEMPERPLRLRFFGAVDTTIVLRDDSAPAALLRISRTHPPTIPPKVFQYERLLSHPPVGYGVYNARTSRLEAAGYLDVEVAPPLHLETDVDVVRLAAGEYDVPFTARVSDREIDELSVAAALSLDDATVVIDQRQRSLNVNPRALRQDTISLTLPPSAGAGSYTISLSGLSPTATAGPATASAFMRGEVFDVDVADGLRVGVVESYDNTLDRALSELDVEHVLLDSVALAEGRFSDLHTIVVDIRAYLVRQDLRLHNDRLLDWVRRGGHLIVNYQKTFEWNANGDEPFVEGRNNPGNFAPYPLRLGRARVTRETAPVTMLRPEHALFTHPNAIDEEVWEGWVQERGLYFPESYAERYIELFSLNDPGEEPLTSSTLLAEYGRGTYLYTALVWYRQLKEFHPGAYRMFANMISLPLTDGRSAGP